MRENFPAIVELAKIWFGTLVTVMTYPMSTPLRVLVGGGVQEMRREVADSPVTCTVSGGEEGAASAVVTVTSVEIDTRPAWR